MLRAGDSHLADVDFAYDPALQLSEVTVHDTVRDGTIVTSYTTDDFGNVVKIVSPDSGTSLFRYNAANRLVESQDARGKKFRFIYDRLGRLVEKQNITTGSPVTDVLLCYDSLNAACGGSDATGDEGRLTAVKESFGMEPLQRAEFSFDAAGRLTDEVRFLGSAEFWTSYEYDASGNPVRSWMPSGMAIDRTFNLADRVTQVRWFVYSLTGATIVTNVGWHPLGRLLEYDFVGGPPENLKFFNLHFTEDSGGLLADIVLRENDVIRESISYAYSDDGNVLRTPAQNGAKILHDSLSRLFQDRGEGAPRLFAYDDGGNRISGPGGTLTYPSSGSNRWSLAESGALAYEFDAAGNATRRGAVNPITMADDGFTSAIQTTAGQTVYTRDYRGLRIQKAGAGGSGTYFYSQEGELIQWIGPVQTFPCESGSRSVTPHETYVSVGGRRVAMVKSYHETYFQCDDPSSQYLYIQDVFWYVSDKMDLARAVYRASDGAKVWSADFDAFANPIGAINEDPDGDTTLFSQPFRLPGQIALTPEEGGPTATAGGLHENWHRIYDSTIGKYLQPDPVRGFAREPQTLNPYPYVTDAPLRYVDRDGRIRVVDRTSECRKCNKNFTNNFYAGLAIARANVAWDPACQAAFGHYLFDIDAALDLGTGPRVVLGSSRPRCSYAFTTPWSIYIPCHTLEGSATQIAATILHELGHVASGRSGIDKAISDFDKERFGDKRGEALGPGFDVERACFGNVVDDESVQFPAGCP